MIDTAIVVCRFLFDAAAIYLWGSAVYLWLLVEPDLRLALWRRQTAIRRAAIVTVLVATAAILPLRTAVIGGDWSAAANADMLVAVITATNIGTAWSVQMAASLTLVLALLTLPVRIAPAATALLAGLTLASLSLTGHAAMNGGWVQPANNALHLLTGGFWIGALPVVLALLPALSQQATRVAAIRALSRFSTAGHVAVALVAASGVVSATLILGRFPPTPGSTYEVLLLVKIGLVALMIVTAVINRYVFVPRLQRHANGIRALAAGTLAEIAMVTVVIALVATFGMMTPA